jgi:hypothetical protein
MELYFRTYKQFATEHARYSNAGRVVEVRTTDSHWIIVLKAK